MAAPARTDGLDVIVELLAELDRRPAGMDGPGFYDRLCTAFCSVGGMQRAGLLLYDEARKLVVPVGSHGIDPELLRDIYGTLEETPIAQVALAEDRVVEISGLGSWVPDRYSDLPGIETLTCTPVSAGGRWLGVIFADRGGGHFELSEAEREAMWTLGKTAALAASARIATSQEERARVLAARIDLAREVHEQVMQRLFGISLVLGSEHQLSDEERRRCAAEMKGALEDLRTALTRPLAYQPNRVSGHLRDELARLGRHYQDLPLSTSWEDGVEVPEPIEPLAQSVLAEALRNAHKHAKPTRVTVRAGKDDGAFILEVGNDGVGKPARRSAGMGLRLAAFEALREGGFVEFGPRNGGWQVRLVVPIDDAD